jgi:hypothetical protein
MWAFFCEVASLKLGFHAEGPAKEKTWQNSLSYEF